jgi:radical SAM superfamily enzyme YgiQ (UPF0313 family)
MASCHNECVRVLLVSTYDSGHQPFGLASPAASLRRAGVEVTCADLAKQRLRDEVVRAADMVAFFLPMHTATRLALPVIDRVRSLNPSTRLCAYGLYAPLNFAMLRERGVSDILGGEFEDALVQVALKGCAGDRSVAPDFSPAPGSAAAHGLSPAVPRVAFHVPDRTGLPPLTRYATLQVGDQQRTSGYTEASRGCKHLCRHCPIVPVYEGRFRVVPFDVVLSDIRAQVAAGAQHITFGDPDFFNGIKHAVAVVESFAREFPGVTYDVTIKVEHLLRHADMLPSLRDTGCAFVTSAVESIDDRVLVHLDKGHTRADFERVVSLCRESGVVLSPTFVAFTPWTTLEGYCELLQEIDRLLLVDHVAPIQLAIRLLVPQGSRLLELEDIRAVIGHFDPRWLTHVWRHPDPRVDALQRDIERAVGVKLRADRREVFGRIWDLAHAAAGLAAPPRRDTGALPRAAVPYLNEPWYC